MLEKKEEYWGPRVDWGRCVDLTGFVDLRD